MAKQESKANGQQQQTDEGQEEQFTPVGPGATAESADEADASAAAEERQRQAEATADDEGEERRVGHSDEEVDDADLPADVRAKRERRRAERKQRKEQYRRDQTELNYLRRRNEDLERRFSGIDQRVSQTEQMTIDARIAQIDDQIRLAEQIHGQAVEKGDGNSATEALRIKDTLLGGKQQLEEAKRRAAATVRQRNQGGQRPDPAIARRAQQWITENDWYDPELRDPDSRVAKTIEEGLYSEGRLDPRSDAYWEEYNRRLAKYLPDKLGAGGRDRDDNEDDEDEEDEDDQRGEQRRQRREPKEKEQRRPGGPSFRTGGRERTLKKGEVYVSAERRAAMEEMGVWDDPVLRNRYLRSFARYDDQAKQRRQQ